MKRSLILLSAFMCLYFYSCNSGNKTTGESPSAEVTSVPIMQVNTLLTDGEQFAGKEVTVEGICTHICKHGGSKMFLMGNTENEVIRIESTDKSGKFPPEVVNALVKVQGTLVEDRIDEAYLQKWEEELKAEMAKHGEAEGGCATEKAARNESAEANSPEARIAGFRNRIAERKDKEGKDYLSFFHLNADSYQIME
ncbi:MAG: hypothetical protein ACRCX4_02825 [Bacteroidales bacterium]